MVYMKQVIYAVFAVLFGAVVFQIYNLDFERRDLKREMATVVDELDLVEADNSNLLSQIEYFSNPRNLEKELRARFNYRLPFEKLIIVIPEE